MMVLELKAVTIHRLTAGIADFFSVLTRKKWMGLTQQSSFSVD